MLAPRRLATLLAAAALMAAPATAHGQGAGDQQYQDPFGGQESGGGTQTTPNVDQTPQLEPTVTTPSAGTGTSSGSATSGTAPAQAGSLPRTGADARLLGAFGLGLLLAGIGLRLRTADERF